MWIDVSNYSGIPSASQIDELEAAGVNGVIVGCQYEGIADEQLKRFKARGFAEELYVYPVYDAGDPARVDVALRLAQRYNVARIWDDIEWNEQIHGPRPAIPVVINGIDLRWRTIRGAGFDVGVYTSETQWPLMTGGRLDGIIRPDDTPLWSAYYYLDHRVPELAAFRPYGPWRTPLMWQYDDGPPIAGLTLDRNRRFDVATVPAPKPADPEDPAPGLDDDEAQELAERRAKALLDISLLYGYRCVPRPGNKVELVNNDETPLNPRIIIPLRVPALT